MKHEEKRCPICDSKMEFEDRIKYMDFACRQDDHFYLSRCMDEMKSNELRTIKIKIRVGRQSDKCYMMKIHLDENFSEVWSIDGDSDEDITKRTKIDIAKMPEVYDIEKLKNKIKLYLVMS